MSNARSSIVYGKRRSPYGDQRHKAVGGTADTKNGRNLWQKRHAEFTALGRAASANGNDIDAENFYQHAEHYLRLMQGTAA